MADHTHSARTMRTVRFHEYGEPADVLRLETAPVPEPGPAASASPCTPAVSPPPTGLCAAACSPAKLPRGIGCDVSGTVEAVGEGVTDVAVGDLVFGTADYAGQPSAGAADQRGHGPLVRRPRRPGPRPSRRTADGAEHRVLAPRPPRPVAGRHVLVNGAGTTIGYAAVQIALHRGLRVIATAGETYAAQLKDLGATVTPYGDGLPERVAALSRSPGRHRLRHRTPERRPSRPRPHRRRRSPARHDVL